jgi:hypothetical protein
VVADMICAEALSSGRLIIVACAGFEFDDDLIWKSGRFYSRMNSGKADILNIDRAIVHLQNFVYRI